MINLTKRQCDILLLLCHRDTFTTMTMLTQEFDVSTRSLRNDIQQVEAFLEERNCLLYRKHGVGMLLQCKEDKKNEIKNELETTSIRIFNKEERRVLVGAMLLTKSHSTFQEFADLCCVSRQTIINSFYEIERWMKREHLQVKKVVGIGLMLSGFELNMRRMLIQVLSDAYCSDSLLDIIAKNIGMMDNLERIKLWIKDIEEFLNISFVNYKRLYIIVAYTLYRIESKQTIKHFVYNESLQAKELVLISERLHRQISNLQECRYLSTIILSERMNQLVLNQEEVDKQDDEAHQIAIFLIASLKQLHKQEYTSITELTQGLTLHLRSAIYRCRNHIQIRNELLEEVKVSISLMYEFTRKQLHKIEELYSITFDENEVAYIAMYIASIYESNIKKTSALRILLICSFGLATSSILKTRIAQVIVDCVIEGPLSHAQAQDYLKHHYVDLIVSTNEFQHEVIPSIIVNPLLKQQDLENIKDKLYQYSYAKMCASFLHSYADSTYREEGKHYLKDYVKHENIHICSYCDTWEHAIQQAANPLIQNGDIEQRYVNCMIKAVYNYGTYMVLTPGIAYVHAGIDDGINENCTSVLVVKEPIQFGIENIKHVRAIVVLGIRDKADSDLLNLAYIFEKKRNIELLKSEDISIEMLEYMHD